MESRVTNDISPESTPGAGRRRARTPHSFPHVKYTTQMSVPDQAELDKLRQRINFTDMDEVRSSQMVVMNTRLLLFWKKRCSDLETDITAEKALFFSTCIFTSLQRSIGSDSQGRVTAANNQRQIAAENKKPHNFLPLHVNTNKSRDLLGPSSSAPATPAISQDMKKQGPGLRDASTPLIPMKDTPRPSRGGNDRGARLKGELGRGDQRIDSSQVKMSYVASEVVICSFLLCIWVLGWRWVNIINNF